MQRFHQYHLLVIILLVTGLSLTLRAQETISAAIPAVTTTRADRLGITHINSAEMPFDANRYANAYGLGAVWTRYPIYWPRIEAQAGQYTWADYDRVVTADVEHGMNTNAVLLGIPDFHRDNNSIAGLNEPIFADGTDVPKADVPFNPNNPWANFVYQTVMRYKPGGTLAQQNGWRTDAGIRVWEAWNEPDLVQFWQGGVNAYARLLKITYLAAHHADPDAIVMFGGLVYGDESNNWLAMALLIYTADPLAEKYNYFFDAVAVHAYAYPWRSGWLVLYARETMDAYKIRRPIWLNETGVAVWDDYPGPTWLTSPAKHPNKVSSQQQAWYIIQSAAHAWAQGADKVLYHQLYDDCGDEAAGTNFPPHNGELCVDGQACFGSAFGLYRNPPGSICYSQHSQTGTARPAAQAFRLLATLFGQSDFGNGQLEQVSGITAIHFDRPVTQERLHVIWNRSLQPAQYYLSAQSESATLYTLTGQQTITPDNKGRYLLALPPAVPDDYVGLRQGDVSGIGGPPVIVVEKTRDALLERGMPLKVVSSYLDYAPPLTVMSAPLPTDLPVQAAILLTPPAVALDVARVAIAPEDDFVPPITFVNPLPEVSEPTFLVQWSAQDEGEIDHYLMWVRMNEGEWIPWIETKRTEAYFTGQLGSRYQFAAWALDKGGNWSENVTLLPQATTQMPPDPNATAEP